MTSYVDIDTTAGTLRGIDNAGVVSFLGVRYGESTAGASRFAPPVPVRPWTGAREVLEFGPAAPQVDTRLGSTGAMPAVLTLLYPRAGSPLEGGPISEDCLRLNIWAPYGHSGDRLPVLVWLHGGAFTHGSGNEMAFNGDLLATAGDVVVVSVTHRIGITGLLDLRDEPVGGVAGSANAGMLDIVEALRWVHENIALVGGDPDNVTIAGQSGGAAKVAVLSAMPAAEGLFARGIMQSGPIGQVLTTEQAEQVRDWVLDRLGVRTAAELRALPLERLLAAQAALLASTKARFGSAAMTGMGGFAPALDPVDVPRHPFGPEGASWFARKPLLIGWASHDAALLLAEEESFTPAMTDEQVVALLDEDAPGQGRDLYDEVSAGYPAEPPHLRWARVLTDRTMRDGSLGIAALTAAHGGQVWVYRFDQTTEVLGGLLGACHSLDLAYVFGTVDRVPLTGRDPARVEVSQAMMRAWASFARNGRPEVDGEAWRPWSATEREVHGFGRPLG